MNQSERGDARSSSDAQIVKSAQVIEGGRAHGRFHAQCIGPVEKDRARYEVMREELFDKIGIIAAADLLRRDSHGAISPSILPKYAEHRELIDNLREVEFEEKWVEDFPNVITTVGANDILDKYFAGSSYTAAIVIGLKGTGTAVIADTQASHASWLEQGLANAPVYTGNRPTPTWSVAAAKAKAFSAAVNFTFTSGGTVFGAFINQGGSATKDNTTGVLVSAGDFTGGSKVVASTDQINVSWSISI